MEKMSFYKMFCEKLFIDSFLSFVIWRKRFWVFTIVKKYYFMFLECWMFMLTISKHCVIKCKTAVKSIFLFRNMKMFYLLDKKNITFLSCHIYTRFLWPPSEIFEMASQCYIWFCKWRSIFTFVCFWEQKKVSNKWDKTDHTFLFKSRVNGTFSKFIRIFLPFPKINVKIIFSFHSFCTYQVKPSSWCTLRETIAKLKTKLKRIFYSA